jgi:ribosomal protein S18 acetylase RimI-like enzyme
MTADEFLFRSLSGIDLSVLHAAWLRAFSDYAVNMQTSEADFRLRLVRDGFRDDMSMGIFRGDEIVGFTLNGVDLCDGVPTAYDVGTALVPGHRGRRLAGELFRDMLPRLERRGVERYLLEVISTNSPAVSLYRKLGFAVQREFSVFVLEGDVETRGQGRGDSIVVREIELPTPEVAREFWEWQPSWQNSSASLARSAGACVAFGAFDGGRLVGYGVVFPSTGNIAQLAVTKGDRRRGAASLVLRSIRREVDGAKPLKMINVDSSAAGTLAFCAAHKFRLVLSQFEMMKSL